MGKHPSITIALVTLVVVGAFIVLLRPEKHRLRVHCYFQNVGGLRAGASVRVAGVDVGSVTSVRVRPELRDHPADVEISIQTSYPLQIPNDAVMTVRTLGLVGETFAEIDISGATGPPLQDGGTLKTGAVEDPASQQILDCLANIAEHKPCNLRPKNPK
ncbi:MAG TPA: MlaD family protein [Candidatus Angelobacter sp.]